MNAGSVIMNHVVKVNKKLSKVNMTQVSKIMMLTNITLNKKKKKKVSHTLSKLAFKHRGWNYNCYHYLKKKKINNNNNIK